MLINIRLPMNVKITLDLYVNYIIMPHTLDKTTFNYFSLENCMHQH